MWNDYASFHKIKLEIHSVFELQKNPCTAIVNKLKLTLITLSLGCKFDVLTRQKV